MCKSNGKHSLMALKKYLDYLDERKNYSKEERLSIETEIKLKILEKKLFL